MDTLDIFKAGRRTPMVGAAVDFSESHLAATAGAYDPAKWRAPLVVGHPKLDDPAYGWVDTLAFADGHLEAVPGDVDPAFAELVRAKRFANISASFWAPDAPRNPVPGVYYLKHVGFLGAVPPAVAGLRTPSFAADEVGVVEFSSEYDDVVNANLWRGLREWIISKFGLTEADQVVPSYSVSTLEQMAQQEVAEAQAEGDSTSCAASPAFSDSPTRQEVSVTPQEKAALEAENAALRKQVADANAEKSRAAHAARHAEHVSFAEGLVAKGTLPPKHLAASVAFMDFAAGDDALSFGEGDAKQPLAVAFRAFLGDLPKVVEFAELATAARAADGSQGTVEFAAPAGVRVDAAGLGLHAKAVAYQAEHKVDYIAAVKAVGGR
jgi:hypothetical protein